jgi:hypothetical protein
MALTRSAEWLERSQKVIAGGVSSDVRRSELPHPLFFRSGKGSRLYDIDGNRYLFRNGMSAQYRPHFLMDRTGAYRRIQVIAVHHRWIGFMAKVVDFTLGECDVGPPEKLECSMLLENLSLIKWDRHFPDAGQLRRYLKQRPPDHVFGEADFREFWDRHCRPLPETEWQQQYPEK